MSETLSAPFLRSYEVQ